MKKRQRKICKHKLHFKCTERRCIGHEEFTEHGQCIQIDMPGRKHKDFHIFICEKCGEEVEIEDKESKQRWKDYKNQ